MWAYYPNNQKYGLLQIAKAAKRLYLEVNQIASTDQKMTYYKRAAGHMSEREHHSPGYCLVFALWSRAERGAGF